MKHWLIKAVSLLKESLTPPKSELNELDWKAAMSPDKKRLTEHLSAFANYPGGGFMVYGIDNSGSPQGVHAKTVETTLNQLSNLGRAALEPPLSLDHAVKGSVLEK
jgi:ATP-dependent DNA helicase RecG